MKKTSTIRRNECIIRDFQVGLQLQELMVKWGLSEDRIKSILNLGGETIKNRALYSMVNVDECPKCRGDKILPIKLSSGGRFWEKWAYCDMCNGSGVVLNEQEKI